MSTTTCSQNSESNMDSYWDHFIASKGPEEVAKQLLQDAARLDEGKMPSQLAMHIPGSGSKSAVEIGRYLTPTSELHPKLILYLYTKIRTRLRKAIEGDGPEEQPLPADGYLTVADFSTWDLTTKKGDRKVLPDAEGELTEQDVQTALKVLHHVRVRTSKTSVLDDAIDIVEKHFPKHRPSEEKPEPRETDWNEQVNKYLAQRPPVRRRVCYICRFYLTTPHPLYRSMCQPCGAFNYSGQSLSLPQNLKLAGRTALVTGARVSLGYHTALRLLRCGAWVIATTRYPHDAALRYAQEADFEEWRARLKVVGADFRTARDAFALVAATKSALVEWGASTLDILINNAAQTLTDSIKKEERAIFQENQQAKKAADTKLLHYVQGQVYQPRVRGGVTPLALYGGDEAKLLAATQPEPRVTLPNDVKDDGRTELESYFKSSWVQSLPEIPYEDIVSAHAINAFVPLILCRELLPLIGSPRKLPASDSHPSPDTDTRTHTVNTNTQKYPTRKPLGYIINVSSREGIVENHPDGAAKRGMHVHTNMTKAAVNMITHTEAASAWRTRGVVMNTVDPGFMSAAPEMDAITTRPLGWEDGAGRVLWPVAIGEVEERAVWGRFLKHYGVVDVEVL